MSIRFIVVNADAVAKELGAKGPAVARALGGVVKRGVLRVANRMVKLVQRGSRSGRTYSRPGGTTHTASAPGEPPKSDSGFLANHIQPTTIKVRGNVISGTVIVSTNYAGFLEKGTSKMRARPYAKPAFQLEAPAINRDAARSIKKALK